MLVDGASEWPQDAWTFGTEGDLVFIVFPQGGQRVRIYTCTAIDQRDRYVGSSGPARFLDDIGRLTCLPQAASLAAATPIGPCATFGGENTWVDTPFVDGVALIGDAAGYNDPLVGEGLSITLRDVRVFSDVLLSAADWSPKRLAPFAEERRERMRRLRFRTSIIAALFTQFGPEGAARRLRVEREAKEGRSRFDAIWEGHGDPDLAPEWAFTDEFRREILQ
jgi:2-polyprenyl-6-methoxyphenol hydroxylase-like FAD-dependent oxidoreductase